MNQRGSIWFLAFWSVLLVSSPAFAAPRESSTPIGGITFDPPRQATVRLKSRRSFRCYLVGVSSELVHIRLQSNREFQYDFADIQSIHTYDKEFQYISATDTYRELTDRARGLEGVTIEDSHSTVAGRPVIPMPRPAAPALPKMVEPPARYVLADDLESSQEVTTARAMPSIPTAPPQVPAGTTGSSAAFHETDAFKIGFLVASLVIIVLWWRNRVG